MRDWEEVFQILQKGNERFVHNKMNNVLNHDFQSFSQTQNPHTVVLCCSDSRISPDIIFDQSLGELFIIQNAGNVCDTSVLGSIQYAVQILQTPLVVVLGHTSCGAVTAAHKHKNMQGPLQSLVSLIDAHIVEGSVADSIKNHTLETAKMLNDILHTHQDKIGQKVKVIAGIYDISNGHISWVPINHN